VGQAASLLTTASRRTAIRAAADVDNVRGIKMSKIRRAKLKGKQLARRLTGISTPIGGLSWTPPVDERDVAKKLLTFLEDRRALFMPYNMEVGPYVVDSILEIRLRLTEDLEQISRSSILGESIAAMRASCRKFLTETQDDPRQLHHWRMEGHIWQALGELRAICGLHIARIACAYDLEIEEQLEPILPAEYEKEGSEHTAKLRRGKPRA